MDYDLTAGAKRGLQSILDYLDDEFGITFTDIYYSDFEHILFLLTQQPEGFPIASKPRNLRKLVFRKRTSIYYKVNDVIEVIAIVDNRQDFKV